MNYTDTITFQSGGLNTDDERRFMPKGDSDVILNLVPNGDGKNGVRTSIRGNRVISAVDYGLSDSQTHTVIGDCYDAKRNVKYIFVHGSGGEHNILKYTYSTDALTFFLQANTKIGLDLSYLITDACVIGDTLFFNPRSSSPRAINIPMLDNYNTYNEYAPATNYLIGDTLSVKGRIFDVIANATGAQIYQDILDGAGGKVRWTGESAYYTTDLYFYNYAPQPTTAPEYEFTTDSAKGINNLSKNIFQFCYRYVYADDSQSITSPFSTAVVPVVSEEAWGEGVSPNIDNQLNITVFYPATDLADFESLAFVEVFFRTSENSGWSNWKMADRIDWRLLISYTTEYTVAFYNDKHFEVVDQDEIARSYSALPKLANAQASLMNDRISYGGITEGFDNISPVVTLTEVLTESPITGSADIIESYTVTEEDIGPNEFRYTIDLGISVPSSGTILSVGVNGVRYDFTITGSPDAPTYWSQLFLWFLHTVGFNVSIDEYGVVEINTTVPKSITAALYNAGTDASFYKAPGFKTGAEHRWCRFYYDGILRRSGAMISEGLKKYIPFITESSITYPGYIYRYSVEWSLSDPPPEGAVYWRFGYAGNTTVTYFIQYIIGARTTIPGTSFETLNIAPLQTTLATDFPHTNIEPYEFIAGDRVRFITPPSTNALVAPYTEYYDTEIVDYDGTAGSETIKIRQFVSPPETIWGTGSIIEIYRPQKTDTVTYHEYGDLYSIIDDGNGNRYHAGQTQNQTSSLPATGVFTIGDIYHITRHFTFPSTLLDELYPVESRWASDFYPSEVWGQGKVGYVDNKGEVTLNNIRYSDPYLQDTDINGLNSFQYLNYVSVNNKYGKIVGMHEVGHTLRVYLETNSLSIPVGRTSYTDADGNEQVVVSDKILGAQRIDVDGYGTVYPESICRVGSSVYFYDSRKGCFIRDDLNGAFPISRYKMERFFKDKSDAIRDGGESNFKVITGYDGKKDLVIVAFDDAVDGSEDVMLAFHEPSNRWVSYLIETSITISNTADMPSWLSQQGELFMSYLWGDTYIHDNSAGYCNFYGIQYGVEQRVYSFEGNNLNKLYEAIAVHCNQRLDLDTIYVYTTETSEGYMLSKIPDGRWKLIEGVYRSDYLRNMYTAGVSSIKHLFNGDFLRGQTIENRLTKDSVTSELNLFKCDIITDKSNV